MRPRPRACLQEDIERAAEAELVYLRRRANNVASILGRVILSEDACQIRGASKAGRNRA